MLKRIRPRRPSPAMVVAMIALVGAFGGSAIADSAVDLAKRAKLINGKKIKARTIRGNRLKRDTLTGKEINESKLAVVPNANKANSATTANNANAVNGVTESQFTVGRSAEGSCDPSASTFVSCASVPLTLPRTGRVLVIAETTWYGNVGGAVRGDCHLAVDGNDASQESLPGQVGNSTDSTHQQSVGLTLITSGLSAGQHTFELQCNELQPNIVYGASWLSAVMIGSA